MNRTLEILLNLAADCTGVRSLPDVLTHPCGAVTLGLGGRCQTQPHTCGAVAGLTVLRHFKPGISADSFFRSVNPTEEDGAGEGKLVRALRSYGLRVQVRRAMAFADIAAAIDLNRPVLVAVKTSDPSVDHWVAVYGYGVRPNRVFLAGTGLPLVSRKEYGWGEFRRMWSGSGEGLVCGRRGSKRAKAAPEPANPAKKGRRK